MVAAIAVSSCAHLQILAESDLVEVSNSVAFLVEPTNLVGFLQLLAIFERRRERQSAIFVASHPNLG